MKRSRRVAVAVVAVAGVLYVAPTGSSAQTLPSQASPVAEEHTHGPDGLELDRRGRPSAAEAYLVDAPAPWTDGQHDEALNEVDVHDGVREGLPMFHAIYIYPSDKASRFTQLASMFQADARDSSRLLEMEYQRAIRFDERGSMLDITVFRSRYNSKQLAGARQFNLVHDELLANGFSKSNKKYVVWLDAASKYCGQAHLSQDTRRISTNANQGRSLAIVYRPYAMTDPTSGGFCRGRTLRHELGHTMGALQSVAPHAYDGAHCNDSNEDTMCYVSATSTDTGPADFDYRNDDYWDPAANPNYATRYGTAYPANALAGRLAWWTVNLSAFICDGPTQDSCNLSTTWSGP